MVTTVSTDQVSQVKKDPTYLEPCISFYPGDTQDDENQPPKLDVKVIMLQGWTPEMYLAALNKSIKRHSVLSLELITIDEQIYANSQ
jgi:hypothetical protein